MENKIYEHILASLESYGTEYPEEQATEFTAELMVIIENCKEE